MRGGLVVCVCGHGDGDHDFDRLDAQPCWYCACRCFEAEDLADTVRRHPSNPTDAR